MLRCGAPQAKGPSDFGGCGLGGFYADGRCRHHSETPEARRWRAEHEKGPAFTAPEVSDEVRRRRAAIAAARTPGMAARDLLDWSVRDLLAARMVAEALAGLGR